MALLPTLVVGHNGQTEGRFRYAIVNDLLLNIIFDPLARVGRRQYGRGAQQQRGACPEG